MFIDQNPVQLFALSTEALLFPHCKNIQEKEVLPLAEGFVVIFFV